MTDDHIDFHLHPAAFLRQTGGSLHVLFAVRDADGAWFFDGEPALIVQHRPGEDPQEIDVEGADALDGGTVELVARERPALAACIEAAFDTQGSFDGELLLAQRVLVRAPRDAFGPTSDPPEV